ncbi:carbohydrate ABC transporter ATP-binding protein (CUT1 family) [Rhizobium sp. PP-F2F-G38]|uniref:ABC transporter ATP-binding protein n=1 Tax=Rhizobium sp. PP-CC-3G-465 TaxID=2135648 RepID=UPI000D88D2CE|nr:carbohydrate ABC transporter ATP-binding protein (CUT1 family) [Rhizobium sp. PP-F2F-G20b]PYE92271.1 carbohydrate ABC transporter ATP-binding protein (CUT1 family) [Rhizobium sp. PP-F2F-G38]TCL89200.1 carbohydrate ABC transporter ATP-binding protein (CUT1 family) [Rhizobium sp. PP-WC-2G-219]TCP82837.1 carbohydrate ABC transporter ATP-binding protein (CUT1 family) [Rhizobium sp. PP-CC-2G-626]TCQ01852.1 carbohydrate ABC transporter ATP-binding protein (CUT1 family) [Rhizobium sp. PP-F2F-G36]T
MTHQIELSGVNKHYGAYHALRDIDLRIKKGSFVALVGPSGCGKSTLLRSMAGLESITSGDLIIAGQTMTNVPPRKRDLAMVFQSYALYPHMTVEENLTYSLRIRGVPKAERKKAAEDVAVTTGLTTLLRRYPRELSGGQRQRVAMSRAIIRHPKAFLFDEPLSNLDAALRVHMRKEIRTLHDRLGATSVYVTHDQIEAMTMADHVVVMRQGVIEQQGAPLDLYDRPVNRFVAGFIGSPAMNFVPAMAGVDGRSLVLDLGQPQTIALDRPVPAGRRLVAGLRPEHLTVEQDGVSAGHGALRLRVAAVESTGSNSYITTDSKPEIVLVTNGRSPAAVGDTVALGIAPAHIHIFDAETEARIATE